MTSFRIFFLILSLLTIMTPSSLFTQNESERQPYAAGRFYENDPAKLSAELEYLFSLSDKTIDSPVLAIISPHAGFVYSGEVAASGFAQTDDLTVYENIFIIGSSHTTHIDGASAYAGNNYLTPLGKVKVNTTLVNRLIEENPYISFLPEAHTHEHIIENQLPFLQHHLKTAFHIVPIVIGTDDERILKSLAQSLSPYLNEKNLFVISADFSHYPLYADAVAADSATAFAIAKNNPEALDEVIASNKKKRYPGMVTSTCGSTTIKTLLYITQYQEDLEYMPLKYMNSGDVPMGDKDRVVGYYSIALVKHSQQPDAFHLSEQDKADLLNVARLTLDEYINKKEIPDLDPEQFSDALQTEAGAFVTLTKNNKLRGCIGLFYADEPLYKVVQQMTLAAATSDRRFPVVRPEELGMIEVEISVLTPLQKINSVDEIELGRDGIYIVKGQNSGTFLPQVGRDKNWTLEEFLGHCARDKAGIGWDGWKEADIFTYRAIVFSEEEAGD